MIIRILLLLALLHTFAFAQDSQACNQPLDTCDDDTNRFPREKRISIKYANKTISKVEYSNNYVDVDVSFDTETILYRFVVCGCESLQDTSRNTISITPKSFYIGNGPSLALYHLLASDNIDPLTAVGSRDTIFNADIRDHITNGGATEISVDFVRNYSKLAQVNPALSIIDTFEFFEYDAANIDVPFLINAETQEQNPLARAEWLKLVGLVLDRPDQANDQFAAIEKRYNDAKKTAEKAIRRPAVFLNNPSSFNDDSNWTLPVTDEYIVQLIRDANADYRYIDEQPVAGGSGMSFDITTVVRDFASADVLIQSSHFPGSNNRTLEEYLDLFEDPPFIDGLRAELEKLKAVRCAAVWSNQKRLTADGQADDFFESAIVQPDEFLLDIIQAVHPYLDLENRETRFVYRYEETPSTTGKCPTTALVGGTLADGEEFVDTKFVVPNLDRYQIADRLEDSIIPEIEQRVDEPYEVFFHHEDVSENATVVTVRVQVNATEAESFIEDKRLLLAMRESFGEDVEERSAEVVDSDRADEEPDPETPEDDEDNEGDNENEDGEDANKEDEDNEDNNENEDGEDANKGDGDGGDGGGLSGGAVAGIVIAVMATVLVVGFLVLKRRSRRQMPVPPEGFGELGQDMSP